jgi:hypothetical protein
MYTRATINEAALRAANSTVQALASDPKASMVTNQDLIDISGLTPPEDTDDLEVHKQWQTAVLQLREIWRYAVLDMTGRWPKTVWGQGFDILPPNKNVKHVDTKVLDDVRRVINKGLRIIRGTRNEDLTYEERQKKVRSQLRFNTLRTAALSAARNAQREATWRDDPPETTTQQQQDTTK